MSDFFNKRILVAGNGVSGVGAKESLLKMGATVSVFCDGDKFVDGDYEMIVLSPSFSKGHFLYEYAKSRDIPIIGEYALGVALNKKPLIAITGTNGKTTVTTMAESILSTTFRVKASGNVGVSFSSLAADEGYDVALTEVSSFQLEQTPYMRPYIAVITNITPDHLIRHKSMEEYAKLKFSVTAHQDEKCFFILPYDDPLYDVGMLTTRAKTLYVSAKSKVNGAYIADGNIFFCGEKVTDTSVIRNYDSYHNRVNALFAVAIAKILGVKNADIASSLSAYTVQPHRLSLVNRINGVNFFDDSKSTNPDSTLKALACMKGETVLILGGSDKGLDFDVLFKDLDNVVKICVIGEIADGIIKTAKKHGFCDVEKFTDLEKATVNAFLLSPENVLLSPASASYGEFSSYKERGEKFRSVIEDIANGKI